MTDRASPTPTDFPGVEIAGCQGHGNRLTSYHFHDAEGRPAGGGADGPGLCVRFQNGPLGRGPDRVAPNGAFVEDLLVAARDRLDFYQRSPFCCEENAIARYHIDHALASLHQRTARREAAGTEGTHTGS